MSGVSGEYEIEIYGTSSDESNFKYDRIIQDQFVVFKYFSDFNRSTVYKIKKSVKKIKVFKVDNPNENDLLKKYDFYLIEGHHLIDLKSYKFYENFQNHMARFYYIHYGEDEL